MNDSIFKEGGPLDIRRTGNDQFTMNVSIPKDDHGRIARQCPAYSCSPGYFKVKPGTGITGGQQVAFCPYCRHAAVPSEFKTDEQLRYAKDMVVREAHKGIQNMLGKALGIGPSGSKKIGGGFISMEMTYKPGSLPTVRHPMEDELRRDIVCPHCGLDHAVFGIAVWCADCGKDIFLTHVAAELSVISLMLSDVDRRHSSLGARVAGRDVENCLEDIVSIFEAVLKALVARHLKERGSIEEEVDLYFKKEVKNKFQNIDLTLAFLKSEFSLDLVADLGVEQIQSLKSTFEKRHPITHNLGVIDKKYMERVLSGDQEGREVRVTRAEIEVAIPVIMQLLSHIHSRLAKVVD